MPMEAPRTDEMIVAMRPTTSEMRALQMNSARIERPELVGAHEVVVAGCRALEGGADPGVGGQEGVVGEEGREEGDRHERHDDPEADHALAVASGRAARCAARCAR
jgi:hypothetical protein